jgi:hypothetical protein
MNGMKKKYKTVVGLIEGNRSSRRPRCRLILKKQGVRLWNEVVWFKAGSLMGSCVYNNIF